MTPTNTPVGLLGRSLVILGGLLVLEILPLLVTGLSEIFMGLVIPVPILQVALAARQKVEQTGQSLDDLIGRFGQRQDGDDDGGAESPADGDEDPEGEVVLGEDSRGDREKGPDDDQDDGQDVAAAGDPTMGAAELVRILLLLSQSAQVLLDQVDIRVQLGEIVLLRIEELAVDEMNDSGAEDGHQIPAQHDLVGAQRRDRNLAALDRGPDQPGDDGQDQTGPGGDDGALAGRAAPRHHIPQGEHGAANDDAHEQVHPPEIQSHLVESNGESSHE
mmetsp:Transcript_16944/g.48972  ORF Transcript_16944/g.48972 Transcript_16944/m.48972 type:complete len:275 (+) Transcript_16944:424-1248(+)